MADYKKLFELIIPFIALSFCAYYVSTIWGAPWEASYYAYALIGGITVCSAVIFYQFKTKPSAPKVKSTEKSLFFRFFPISIVFVAAIYFIGYVAATFLFMLVAPPVIGYRKWKTLLIVDIIFVASAYVLFIMILKVDLPAGLIF